MVDEPQWNGLTEDTPNAQNSDMSSPTPQRGEGVAHQWSDYTLGSLSVSIGNMSLSEENDVSAREWDSTSPPTAAASTHRHGRTSLCSTTSQTSRADSFQAAIGNILKWVSHTTAHTTQAAAAAAVRTNPSSTATPAAAAAASVPSPLQHRHSLATTLSSRSSQSPLPLSAANSTRRQDSLGNMSVIVSSRGDLFYGDFMQVDSFTSLPSYEEEDDDLDEPLPPADHDGPRHELMQQQRSQNNTAVRQLLLDTGAQLNLDPNGPPTTRGPWRRPTSTLSLLKLSRREMDLLKDASLRSIGTTDMGDDTNDGLDSLARPSTGASASASASAHPTASHEDVVYYKLIWQTDGMDETETAAVHVPSNETTPSEAPFPFGLAGHKDHSLMSVGTCLSEDGVQSSTTPLNYATVFDEAPDASTSVPPLPPPPTQYHIPEPVFYEDVQFGNDTDDTEPYHPLSYPTNARASGASIPPPVYFNDIALATHSGPMQPPASLQNQSIPPPVFYQDVAFGVPSTTHAPSTSIPQNPVFAATTSNTIGNDEITAQDVLVVDGSTDYQDHAGNQTYGNEVAKRQARFQAASDPEKLAIRLDLMNCVKHTGGRFLKPDKKEKHRWKVMDPKAVRTKATKDLSGVVTAVKTYITDDVMNTDVLMGRGAHGVHHPGNQAYLAERDRLRPAYVSALADDAKHSIGLALVQWVHMRGGRFLKQDTNKQWYIMDKETVEEAAMQKLREERRQG